MSEYLVQRQSLKNIADEIRVLSGTTEPLGLTEMATNVKEANDEVADQTDLIAQVVSALQGKSVPGGGGVETCTVTINYIGPPLPNTEAKIYYTDETQTAKDVVFVWGTAYKVIKGSMIRIYCGVYTFPISSGTNYTIVQAHSQDKYYFITGDVTFSVA